MLTGIFQWLAKLDHFQFQTYGVNSDVAAGWYVQPHILTTIEWKRSKASMSLSL